MDKILVIAAHPDDEILGVGGTLRKHVKKGDSVYCLILGEGVLSRGGSNKDVADLKKETEESTKVIGFKEVIYGRLEDNKFDSVPLLDVVKEVEKIVKKVKPSIVYTHHLGDVNVDHKVCFEAVMTACRPCNPDCPKEIYCFETLSSTEWQIDSNKVFFPNVFVDISKEIEDKVKAMKKYKSELRDFPHSRSIEGIISLASLRGVQAGVKAAEGFYLARSIR